MANIAYGRAGHVAVMVAGRENPSDAEWEGYIDFLESMDTPGPSSRTLAVTAGGAPGPAQRVRLEKRIGARRVGSKVAVVTGSTFARGVLNAWSVIRPGYRAFAPDKLDDAIRFLDIPLASVVEIKSLVGQLQSDLALAVT